MNKKCKAYIMISLLITWLLTFFFYRNEMLVNGIFFLMLVPLITALIIRISTEGFTKNIIRNPKAKGLKAFLKAIIFSLVFVFVFIIILAFLGAVIYKNQINNEFIIKLFDFKFILYRLLEVATLGAIVSLGEEYGWRAFLLPELSKGMSRVKATVIVGIVWGLYHLPIVAIMNFKGHIGNPYLVAVIQALAAAVLGFAFCYCYFISNRVYPCVIMHGFWNVFNPYVLGSVYMGKHGVVLKNADVFITNGEGVLGMVLGVLLIPIFIFLIKKTQEKEEIV